jgi:hypothetical protein
MSDFFEPPPQRELSAPQRYRQPPWTGSPQGTLPGVVALEIVLAQNDRVAVCVSRLGACPAGFAFEVVTMTAVAELELDPLLFHHPRHVGPGEPGAIPPEMLRLGIQFADGSKATTQAVSTIVPGGLTARSWLRAVAGVELGTGVKTSGSGRSRRRARSPWCANGRRWRSH